MSSSKSRRTSKEPCVASDGLYADDHSNVKDILSRQKSGTMTPPGSIGTLESHGVESFWQSEQAPRMTSSSNKGRVSTTTLSIQQARSYPPVSQATIKRNIPTFEHLDLPLDNDQWFPEGQTSEMMIPPGGSVERGMLFPWMTDSEIV